MQMASSIKVSPFFVTDTAWNSNSFMTTEPSPEKTIKRIMNTKQTLHLGGGTVFGELAAVALMNFKTSIDTDTASGSDAPNGSPSGKPHSWTEKWGVNDSQPQFQFV